MGLNGVGWEIRRVAKGCSTLQEVTRAPVGRSRSLWWKLDSPGQPCCREILSGDRRLLGTTGAVPPGDDPGFSPREPLSSRKLSQYANLADATESRTLVRQLKELYDQNRRAFRVEEVAGGYRLLTRPRFLDGCGGRRVRRKRGFRLPLWKRGRRRLSKTDRSTDIEAVRGQLRRILRQLIDRDGRIAGTKR